MRYDFPRSGRILMVLALASSMWTSGVSLVAGDRPFGESLSVAGSSLGAKAKKEAPTDTPAPHRGPGGVRGQSAQLGLRPNSMSSNSMANRGRGLTGQSASLGSRAPPSSRAPSSRAPSSRAPSSRAPTDSEPDEPLTLDFKEGDFEFVSKDGGEVDFNDFKAAVDPSKNIPENVVKEIFDRVSGGEGSIDKDTWEAARKGGAFQNPAKKEETIFKKPPPRQAPARGSFEAMDRDLTDVITKSEFDSETEGKSQAWKNETFKELDGDRSGEVEEDEWNSALKSGVIKPTDFKATGGPNVDVNSLHSDLPGSAFAGRGAPSHPGGQAGGDLASRVAALEKEIAALRIGRPGSSFHGGVLDLGPPPDIPRELSYGSLEDHAEKLQDDIDEVYSEIHSTLNEAAVEALDESGNYELILKHLASGMRSMKSAVSNFRQACQQMGHDEAVDMKDVMIWGLAQNMYKEGSNPMMYDPLPGGPIGNGRRHQILDTYTQSGGTAWRAGGFQGPSSSATPSTPSTPSMPGGFTPGGSTPKGPTPGGSSLSGGDPEEEEEEEEEDEEDGPPLTPGPSGSTSQAGFAAPLPSQTPGVSRPASTASSGSRPASQASAGSRPASAQDRDPVSTDRSPGTHIAPRPPSAMAGRGAGRGPPPPSSGAPRPPSRSSPPGPRRSPFDDGDEDEDS